MHWFWRAMIGVVLAGFAVTILLPALAQPLFGSKQIYFYYKINAEVLVAGLAWFGLAAGIVTFGVHQHLRLRLPNRTPNGSEGLGQTPLEYANAPSQLRVLLDALNHVRRKPGCCKCCGYDLTRHVSGVCPECRTRIGQYYPALGKPERVKLLKWSSTAAALLLLELWTTSIFWDWSFAIRDEEQIRIAQVTCGCKPVIDLHLVRGRVGLLLHDGWSGCLVQPAKADVIWLPGADVIGKGVGIRKASRFWPLWIPFVIVAVPTIWLWRHDRPNPAGHCQRCGYNLTGNVSGVCPECGRMLDEPQKGTKVTKRDTSS